MVTRYYTLISALLIWVTYGDLRHYGAVPKGILTFLGFFMQCGVQSLLGTSGIYPGTYSPGLFAGLFSDAIDYCLQIVSCETTGTK